MSDYLTRLISVTVGRVFAPHNLVFRRLMTLTYMPKDRRYKRNAIRFRSEIQKMINDRRSGRKSSYTHEDEDLLSILLGTDFY